MKKILSFGASNSKNSINKLFAHWTADQLNQCDITKVDLNDFDLPIYGIDLENELGIPENASRFSKLIESHDGIIVSFAEHNGNFAAVFKNIMDWVSRLDGKLWKDKNLFLLSTSPGGRGGKNVMDIALNLFPFQGGNVIAHFSLPQFGNHFTSEGIQDDVLNTEFGVQLQLFQATL